MLRQSSHLFVKAGSVQSSGTAIPCSFAMRRRPSRWRSNPVKTTKVQFLTVKLQDLTEVGARTSIQQGVSNIWDQRPPTSRRDHPTGCKDLQPAGGPQTSECKDSQSAVGITQVPSTSRKHHNYPQPQEDIMQVSAKTSQLSKGITQLGQVPPTSTAHHTSGCKDPQPAEGIMPGGCTDI